MHAVRAPKGGRVQVLLKRVDSQVEVSIVDTGEGISDEFLPYIFDRLKHADASTTRRYRGLGLGLSLVKQLVELHGGTMRGKSGGLGGCRARLFGRCEVKSGIAPVDRLVSEVMGQEPYKSARRVFCARAFVSTHNVIFVTVLGLVSVAQPRQSRRLQEGGESRLLPHGR